MILKCTNKNCNYSWQYKGKSRFYATCPRCLGKVRVKEITEGQIIEKQTNEVK